MIQKSKHELEKEINDFNAKYKIGQKVELKKDSGEIVEVTIKHEATILGGHTAVGWFDEISGAFLLSRVIGPALRCNCKEPVYSTVYYNHCARCGKKIN